MELDNHAAKQAYIQLLVETLQKKIEILYQLTALTEKQERVILADDFNDDEFMQIISLKDEQIQALNKLDIGFEQIFNSVKEELVKEKVKYTTQISGLQNQIKIITNLSIGLQALEQRNKAKIEAIFAIKRMNIKKARISSQTVTNYYKAMAHQHESQSYFYDKKK